MIKEKEHKHFQILDKSILEELEKNEWKYGWKKQQGDVEKEKESLDRLLSYIDSKFLKEMVEKKHKIEQKQDFKKFLKFRESYDFNLNELSFIQIELLFAAGFYRFNDSYQENWIANKIRHSNPSVLLKNIVVEKNKNQIKLIFNNGEINNHNFFTLGLANCFVETFVDGEALNHALNCIRRRVKKELKPFDKIPGELFFNYSLCWYFDWLVKINKRKEYVWRKDGEKNRNKRLKKEEKCKQKVKKL